MIYFASKTHDRLNGEPFIPERIAPLCINPYYPITIDGGQQFMIDSGAFQDVGSNRLTFQEALDRQLLFEKTVTIEKRPADAIVSYDRLVDEQYDGESQFKKRVSYEDGESYVQETIDAARFLASKRKELRPRRLILSCQGTTTEQYLKCLNEVLSVAEPEDIIGLGGFCIISKSKEYEQQFYEVINQGFPNIAERGITRVHIFGVGLIRALVQAELLGRRYGIECSYDTSSYEVNAVFGRIFDPINLQTTGCFSKKQKGNGYTSVSLTMFNIRMVKEFWNLMEEYPSFDDFQAGIDYVTIKTEPKRRLPSQQTTLEVEE